MSQATARQTRREIRRAVGVHGLAAVNNTSLEVYQHVLPTLEEHDKRITSLDDRNTRQHHAMIEAAEPLRRPFFGRLRWLFLGR